jgi:acyl-[acyl carrier protein]--UDP-N-acetylglucosamine O-acyltransferase
MAKIFVRERTRVGKGEGLPRFAIVGVEGSDLKFFQLHVRKSELDAIAQAVGAEVVMLPRGTGQDAGEGSGGGKRQKRSVRRRTTRGDA